MMNCTNCQSPFEITSGDQKFYEKISPEINGKKYFVPPPTHCPDCRQQRRLAWRNEWNFYRNKCGLTGKPIISIYPPDSPYTVYHCDVWEEQTQWDPLSYGRDYDFSRPFFEQMKDLQLAVPRRASVVSVNTINSEYCNHVWNVKNCYLCVNMGYNEDCLYCQECFFAKNLLDCFDVKNSELCAYCFLCNNCYNSVFLENCAECSDTAFCIDCKDCHHVILCSNLRHKKYCILNKEYSKEDYFKELERIQLGKRSVLDHFLKKYKEVKQAVIFKENYNVQVENCVGDYLKESQNCRYCFNDYKSRDCKYVFHADSDVKDCYDFNHCAEIELGYEGTCTSGYHNMFCSVTVRGSNNYYCDNCEQCDDCFGCIGLLRKKFCILNKQYTKEGYFELLPRAIDHMKSNQEFGEFFPIGLSPFAYNETVANDEFPVTKEEAVEKGWKWRDVEEEKNDGAIGAIISDDIKEVSDDITNEVLSCHECHSNFRIISQELGLYRQMNMPIPIRCSDCRRKKRSKLCNPHTLWPRKCGKCGKEISTTYSRERGERVYCESCYLKEVY